MLSTIHIITPLAGGQREVYQVHLDRKLIRGWKETLRNVRRLRQGIVKRRPSDDGRMSYDRTACGSLAAPIGSEDPSASSQFEHDDVILRFTDFTSDWDTEDSQSAPPDDPYGWDPDCTEY
jgi:hypothetical protein